MTANAWKAVGALLVIGVLLLIIGMIVPEWLRERHRRTRLTETLDGTRRQLAETQAQLETMRQSLIRCREQVLERGAEEQKKLDPVDRANTLLRGKRHGP